MKQFLIIGIGLILAACTPEPAKPAAEIGRFVLHPVQGSEDPHAWRLDTKTGALEMCTTTSTATINCSFPETPNSN